MSARRSAALALVAALVLAGCQDEPEPKFEPTPSDSASPTDPETSEQPEAQSAEAFIRDWVRLDAEMQRTGETSAYLDASVSCTPCEDFAARVENVYRAGGEIRTDGWRVLSIEQLHTPQTFRMIAISSPQVVVPEAGADEERYPGGRATYDVSLRRAGNTWRVEDWFEVAT